MFGIKLQHIRTYSKELSIVSLSLSPPPLNDTAASVGLRRLDSYLAPFLLCCIHLAPVLANIKKAQKAKLPSAHSQTLDIVYHA